MLPFYDSLTFIYLLKLLFYLFLLILSAYDFFQEFLHLPDPLLWLMLRRFQLHIPRGRCGFAQPRHLANSSEIHISLDYFHPASNPILGLPTVVRHSQFNKPTRQPSYLLLNPSYFACSSRFSHRQSLLHLFGTFSKICLICLRHFLDAPTSCLAKNRRPARRHARQRECARGPSLESVSHLSSTFHIFLPCQSTSVVSIGCTYIAAFTLL